MIKNKEIRSYVNQRIKPFKGRIIGYTLLFALISFILFYFISVIVFSFASVISMLLMTLVKAIFDSAGIAVGTITLTLVAACLFIILALALLFVSILAFNFLVGFKKEILLCVNNENKTGPLDFFKLGFKDFKKNTKVLLNFVLKCIGPIIVTLIGFVLMFGFLKLDNSTIKSILYILGIILHIISYTWGFVMFLRYQTTFYDMIYNENLSPKEVLKKSKNTIKGHIWQWTRMHLYYPFIFGLIKLIFIIGLMILLVLWPTITTDLGGLMVFLLFAIVICFNTVITAFLSYFMSKNVLNLNELYKVITK